MELLKKKKHKKHKKHKKTSKSEKGDKSIEKDKSASKKHKKRKRKTKKDSDQSDSDSGENNDEIIPTVVNKATTSLSSKFTEIMKTNGHVAAPKIIKKPVIPTDPTELVDIITKSLNHNVPALEIVSSDSESDGIVDDVDSPDVAVIEDELNLEELMKQKALLQARLGDIVSESDNDDSEKKLTEALRIKKKQLSDVILLDDSSGEVIMRKSKKLKNSPPVQKDGKQVAGSVSKENRRETSRERYIREERLKLRRNDADRRMDADRRIEPDRRNDSDRRIDVDNRYKEDLRREIDRDKERSFREREHRRREVDRNPQVGHNNRNDWQGSGRERSRYSMERDRRASQRSRSRDRYDRMDRGGRSRDRDRGGNRRKEEKRDKFVGSLSEGQKPEKDTSSESDYGETTKEVEEEDDEEKIIEMRRKKREELLKKLSFAKSRIDDDDDDVIHVPNVPPSPPSNGNGKASANQTKQFGTPATNKSMPPPATKDTTDDIMMDSTTPPLPPGLQLKLAAAAIKETDEQPTDTFEKSKEVSTTKRNDWDMFAEQDIDSNFDVSQMDIITDFALLLSIIILESKYNYC